MSTINFHNFMENLPKFIHPNPSTFNSINHQNFSLPIDTIFYIIKNPKSAIGFEKIQKTCKYFFAKNQIIVINKEVTYNKHHLIYYFDRNQIFKQDLYLNNNKIKYWVTNEISLIFENTSIINITKNIYRCNLRRLTVTNQNLKLHELDFLFNGGKINSLTFTNVKIKDNENENILISIDQILEKIPCLTCFYYNCENEIFTTKIFENLIDLNFKSKFIYFRLAISKFSIDADISLLSHFIDKNSGNATCFCFEMKMINSGYYRYILQAALDEIIFWNGFNKPNILIH